jgi:hypothetical protein
LDRISRWPVWRLKKDGDKKEDAEREKENRVMKEVGENDKVGEKEKRLSIKKAIALRCSLLNTRVKKSGEEGIKFQLFQTHH